MYSTYADIQFEQLRAVTAFGTFCVERVGHQRNMAQVVLLLHGFGTNASLWRGVGARLARSGCQVLAPDLLGHGASEWPAHAPYTLSWHADSLAAAIATLGVVHVGVVGQDTGGLVAMQLAARHPELVQQLVLVNPPDHRALPPTVVRSMLRVADRLALGTTRSAFASHETEGPARRTNAGVQPADGVAGQTVVQQADNRLAATALVAALLTQCSANPDQPSPATVARYLAPYLADGGAEQLWRMARELARDTLSADTLHGLIARTLVLRSGQDRSVPEEVARTLTASLPDAVLRFFPHHGRLLADEAPDSLARTVLDFLQLPSESVATEQAVHA